MSNAFLKTLMLTLAMQPGAPAGAAGIVNGMKPSEFEGLTDDQFQQLVSVRSFHDFRNLSAATLAAGVTTSGLAGIGSLDAAIVAIKMSFFQSMNDTPDSPFDILLRKEESDRMAEDLIIVDGAPAMQPWQGDRRHSSFRALKYRIESQDFSNGLEINAKAYRRNGMIIKSIIDTAAQLGRAAKWRFNYMCGQRLGAEAFPGSTRLSPTDKTLIATDHAMFDGPAFSNHLGALAFTQANVDIAIAKLEKMKTWDGSRYVGRVATHFICGPDLKPAATRMFAAVNSTGGQDAYLAGRCSVLCIPEMADAGAGDWWYVADLNSGKPLVMLETQGVEWSEDRTRQHDNNIVKMGADCCFGIEPNDPTCIVGSKPS